MAGSLSDLSVEAAQGNTKVEVFGRLFLENRSVLLGFTSSLVCSSLLGAVGKMSAAERAFEEPFR
eukprot:752414-Hanusia_phi.AAC.4